MTEAPSDWPSMKTLASDFLDQLAALDGLTDCPTFLGTDMLASADMEHTAWELGNGSVLYELEDGSILIQTPRGWAEADLRCWDHLPEDFNGIECAVEDADGQTLAGRSLDGEYFSFQTGHKLDYLGCYGRAS